MSAFAGFPAEAIDFYVELAANNSRAWWNEHRETYERAVREPMEAMLEDLQGEFGSGRIFRPYRDVRFSKDKAPIKDHQGAIVQIEDAVGYYVQISGSGLMVAGGWYAPVGPQVARFRQAVQTPAVAALDEGLATARRARPNVEVETRPLKTRPRGVAADHPRLDLLRSTCLILTRTYGTPEWLGTAKARDVVRRDWRVMAPVVEWLADHVGPAEEPD